MADTLHTAREVADRLGVSPETILRWVRAGDLPAIRLGRAIRFREAEVDRWLNERATPQRGVLTTTPDAARPGVSLKVLTTTNNEES